MIIGAAHGRLLCFKIADVVNRFQMLDEKCESVEELPVPIDMADTNSLESLPILFLLVILQLLSRAYI